MKLLVIGLTIVVAVSLAFASAYAQRGRDGYQKPFQGVEGQLP
jgi:hypothetical protein